MHAYVRQDLLMIVQRSIASSTGKNDHYQLVMMMLHRDHPTHEEDYKCETSDVCVYKMRESYICTCV